MDALPAQGARARFFKIVRSHKTWLGGSLCILLMATLTLPWIYTTPHGTIVDYVVQFHDNTSQAGLDTPLFVGPVCGAPIPPSLWFRIPTGADFYCYTPFLLQNCNGKSHREYEAGLEEGIPRYAATHVQTWGRTGTYQGPISTAVRVVTCGARIRRHVAVGQEAVRGIAGAAAGRPTPQGTASGDHAGPWSLRQYPSGFQDGRNEVELVLQWCSTAILCVAVCGGLGTKEGGVRQTDWGDWGDWPPYVESGHHGERRQAVGAFKVKKEQQHGLPDCKAISRGNVRRYQGLLVPEWPWWWPGPYYARGHSPQGRMEDDQEAFIRRGGTLAWCRNVSGEEQYHRKPGVFSISDFRLIRLELGSSPRIPRTIMTIGLSHDIFLYFLYVQLSFPIEAVELTIFGLVDTGCTFIWNISCMCSAHMRPVSGFSSIGDDEI